MTTASSAKFRLVSLSVSSLALVLTTGPAEAHGDLDQAIREKSLEISADVGNATLYVQRAELHRLHDDCTQAVSDYEAARTKGADFAHLSPEVSVGYAICLGKLGSEEKAEAELGQVLLRFPHHVGSRLARARLRTARRDFRPAVADFDEAIKASTHPEPEYYVDRAKALCALGAAHVGEALRGLDEGSERLQRPVQLELLALEIEIEAKRYDAAIARIDRALGAARRPETWWVRRADVLVRAGRSSQALEAARQALVLMASLPARLRTPATVELERRARSIIQGIDRK